MLDNMIEIVMTLGQKKFTETGDGVICIAQRNNGDWYKLEVSKISEAESIAIDTKQHFKREIKLKNDK